MPRMINRYTNEFAELSFAYDGAERKAALFSWKAPRELLTTLPIAAPGFSGPYGKQDWFKESIAYLDEAGWELCDVMVYRACLNAGWVPPGRCYQEQLRAAAFMRSHRVTLSGYCAHRLLGVPIPHVYPTRAKLVDNKFWVPEEEMAC